MKLAKGALGAAGAAGLVVAVSGSAWAADVSTEPAADYDKTSVVICSGDAAHLVDSVTAGPLASAQQTSILLAQSSALGSEATSYLSSAKPPVVYVVGGTAAVPASEETAIAAADPGVTIYRVSGSDRYATAHAIATLVDRMYAHFASSSSS